MIAAKERYALTEVGCVALPRETSKTARKTNVVAFRISNALKNPNVIGKILSDDITECRNST